MKKIIYSIDGYSELEIDFQKVDLTGTNDLTSLLREISDGVVISAKKDVSVYATPVLLGSKVDTRMRFNLHGRAYVFDKNIRKITERDVITNSKMILYTDGQTVVLKGEKFEEMYKLENKVWELYKPIDFAKKYITIKKNIYYKTPWGEIIYAPTGSKLCVEYANNRDFFIVTNSLFRMAYREIGEVGTVEDLQL